MRTKTRELNVYHCEIVRQTIVNLARQTIALFGDGRCTDLGQQGLQFLMGDTQLVAR
jgi:hypothetical protein